jgi:concentrative nucleoside transporter, CNT family
MAHIVPASLKRSPSLDSAKERLPKDTAITARDLTDDVEVAHGSEEKQSLLLYPKLRPYILTALALLILGWWISATVLKATRDRWYALYFHSSRPSYLCDRNRIVQTIFAWAFIL